MNSFLQDLRYGFHMLIKQPAFTAVAIVTLALGIGTNAAIFSLLNAVLLKPLPFPDPDRLVIIWEDASAIGFPRGDPAPGSYQDWKTRNTVFADIAALDPRNFNLTGEGEPERLFSWGVTANLIPLLGVQPILGRSFSADEDKPGGPKVTIISHGLWQRGFGGDKNIIGRQILLNAEKYEVVGVMPPAFQLLQTSAGLLVPAGLTTQQLADYDNHYLTVLGRLKPGLPIEQAQAEIKTIMQQIAREHPEELQNTSAEVVSFREQLTGNVRRPLILLMVAVGFVLLIACANMAGLLLSRAAGRRKEIALRAALGASRARIVRQLLTESLLLSAVGGTVGLLVALWSFKLLQQLIPDYMTDMTTLSLDGQVLGYSMLISLLTGICFGLVPALQSSRTDLNESLKQGGRGFSSSRSRTRGVFIVAQVALALILLIGAGLMIQTVFRLRHPYAGFQPEALLTLRTTL